MGQFIKTSIFKWDRREIEVKVKKALK